MSETMNADTNPGTPVSPFRTLQKMRLLTAEELLSTEQSAKFGKIAPPLQQLSIKGLLSFGEETVFEFGQLNLLIGPNGSGKSNLLNCIRVLRLAPLDIQQAFQDSGFEDWLYKGADLKSASLQAKLNVPEPIRHRIRFLPQSAARAALEEVIDGELKDPLFIGSHRGGATVSAIGKRRRGNRILNADEYNPLASILAQIRDASQGNNILDA